MMEPVTAGLAGIGLLLAMIFLFRIPVGFAMALTGYIGFAVVVNPKAALGTMASSIWHTFSSYGLAVIPLFILMGNICFHTGVSRRLYHTAYVWTGSIRGGIAMATVLACAGFAAICGSNAATAATMSSVALPEMKKLGYDDELSTGSVAAGATLGVVIPPSVVLIIIGLSTGLSIADLFFAALWPGLLLTVSFLSVIWIMCLARPRMGPRGERTTMREKIAALPGSIEMVVLFLLVMTGLYKGWFTPTEAGAAGAFFAIAIALCGKTLTWQRLVSALDDSVRTSSMILMIVAGAVIFGKFLTVTRLPYQAADWASALPVPSWAILVTMLGIYVAGGAIMDALGLLMITIPIFFPVARRLGYDPLWFSVLITIITTLGAITPPVGINTYIVAGIAKDIPLTTVFRGVTYFLAAFAFTVLLLFLFPELASR